jgi:hypothetical protein
LNVKQKKSAEKLFFVAQHLLWHEICYICHFGSLRGRSAILAVSLAIAHLAKPIGSAVTVILLRPYIMFIIIIVIITNSNKPVSAATILRPQPVDKAANHITIIQPNNNPVTLLHIVAKPRERVNRNFVINYHTM